MEYTETPYLIPITLEQANSFIQEHREHFHPYRGRRFAIGCAQDGKLTGAVIVGPPFDSELADGQTLAVNYVYTTGGRTAYGMLYGAAARAAKAMGYWRITACLSERVPGSALRAAGWHHAVLVESGNPKIPNRVRYEQYLSRKNPRPKE